MLEVPYLAPTLPDDRSGRFIATGVILILVALMSGCATAMIPVSVVLQKRMAQQIAAMQTANASRQPGPSSRPISPASFPQPDLTPLVIGGVMYLGFTVAAGWLAVAALLKRRYVRPLVMIFATHGVIFGGLMLLAFVVLLPMQWHELTAGQPTMAGPAVIGLTAGIVMTLVVMIGVPITLLILMKPDAVRETAEHYDLRRRWTDGVPIKLLGLVVTLAIFALFELTALHNPSLPLVVTVVKGPLVVLIFLAHAGLMVVAAVLIYRRRMLGWHLAFFGMVIPTALVCLSSVLLPSDQFLLMSDQNQQTLDMARRYESSIRILWTAVAVAMLVSTILYLRKMRPLVEPPVATAVMDPVASIGER